MAVQLGKDYAVARKTAWLFETGVGNSTAVLTRACLYVFPHDAIGGRHDTTYTIGGRPPAQVILELLANPATTSEILDTQMRQWSAQVAGPIVIDMAEVKRVRVYTGFIRRSVVFSLKESGYDFAPTSVRPRKDEMPAFLELLKGRPGLEVK